MSIRKFVVPALAAAGFVLLAQPAGAAGIRHHAPASGWHHGHGGPGQGWQGHGGHAQGWQGHGWQGATYYHFGHHGHRHHHRFGYGGYGVVPYVIPEGAPSQPEPIYSTGRVPGIPDAVPYVSAGPSPALTGGSYSYGGYDLPSEAGGGTYAGGIAAVYDPGNGTYIAVDPGVMPLASEAVERPSAKIITVTADSEKAACRMEHGVCVIRP